MGHLLSSYKIRLRREQRAHISRWLHLPKDVYTTASQQMIQLFSSTPSSKSSRINYFVYVKVNQLHMLSYLLKKTLTCIFSGVICRRVTFIYVCMNNSISCGCRLILFFGVCTFLLCWFLSGISLGVHYLQ